MAYTRLFVLVLLTVAPTTALLPTFSWSTVPVYWHACNSSGAFNAAALEFLTQPDHPFASVTIEKGQGINGSFADGATAEARILFAAAQLKALKPQLPVVAYFNSVLNWPYYALAADMAAHPEWSLKNSSGLPVLIKGDSHFPQPIQGMEVFDFSSATVRSWFANATSSALPPTLIDGCFQDRANEESFPGVPAAAAKLYASGHDAVLREIQAGLGSSRFLIQNNYLSTATGARAMMFENFDATEASILQLMQAAQLGFLVQAHAGNELDGSDNHCEDITNVLAAFLIGASENTFFACSKDWQIDPGFPSVPSDWMTWHEQYSKPLGAPHGPAVKISGVWRRTFGTGNVNVSFDTSSNVGVIEWGSAAAAAAAAAISAPAELPPASASCSPPAFGSSISISLNSSSAPPTAATLYLRHAGFVGYATPVLTALDKLDSTFVIRSGLSGGPSLSFENADEFPGYFLFLDSTSAPPRLILAQRPAAPVPAAWDESATFLAGPALPGGSGCSLSPASSPQLYLSIFSSAPPPPATVAAAATPATPCHYPVCPAVQALPLPPPAQQPAFAGASSWGLAPPYVPPPPGVTSLTLGGLAIEVHNDTGTLGRLSATWDGNFSFTPLDSPTTLGPKYEHLGDVTVRARATGNGSWTDSASTATSPPPPGGLPRVQPSLPGSVWATDISQQLSSTGAGAGGVLGGLKVVRELGPAPDGKGMVLSLLLSNVGTVGMDIGGLDVSLPFNNNWNGLSLEENAATCSLSDPYMGMDGGFIRVVRISGVGPILLVTPYAHPGCPSLNASGKVAACQGSFEAYRMLESDPTPRGVTFEGFYAWVFLSAAWAETDWGAAQPYNEPHFLTLQPGQQAVFSLRLFLTANTTADSSGTSVQGIEGELAAVGMPVVVALPGTVLTPDIDTAQLLLKVPPSYSLDSVVIEPAGAITLGMPSGPPNAAGFLQLPMAYGTLPLSNLSHSLRIRATLSLNPLPSAISSAATGGLVLRTTVQLLLLPPLPGLVQTFVDFASASLYLPSTAADAFGRSASFLHWDASTHSPVLQESRAWVAGLSDESGAGSALGVSAALASLAAGGGGSSSSSSTGIAAAALAVAQLATFLNRTLLGEKPDARGVRVSLVDPVTHGVRASMFWGPGMPGFNYTVTPCWNEERSKTQWRSYNYPHPVATLLALYRVARELPGLVEASAAVAAASGGALDALAPWGAYLAAASDLHTGMGEQGRYNQYGLMVASVFYDLIDALEQEAGEAGGEGEWGWRAGNATALQQARTLLFLVPAFPFGSEMPWDSTGQEEIFVSTHRFGGGAEAGFERALSVANLTLNAVKAYTPVVPHALYSGSSRRYFDFLVYGDPVENMGAERGLHHYGAGLNGIVLGSAAALLPNDTYAVRAAFAASWAPLLAIDPASGAPSMSFHGDPSKLVWDAYSGDWGQNMWGGAATWGCRVAAMRELAGGLAGFGCDILPSSFSSYSSPTSYTLKPYDPLRGRLYLGPVGLQLTLRTGAWATALWQVGEKTLTVTLEYNGDSSSTTTTTTSGSASQPPLYSSLQVLLATPALPGSVVEPAVNPSVCQPPGAVQSRGAWVLPWNTSTITICWQ